MRSVVIYILAALGILLSGCRDTVWNMPHDNKYMHDSVFYSSFTSPPKTLDPSEAYSADSYAFINQIYEPPLQYHYLKRPYQLIPLSAEALPTITYYNAKGEPTTANADDVNRTVYTISIRPHMYYQPHPAFAQDEHGTLRYHHLSPQEIARYQTVYDFKEMGSREVTAEDFVYAIKRLASPHVNTPILSLMENYIVGLKTLESDLDKAITNHYIDLNQYTLEGVQTIDRYHYRITIQGKYPQFIYWLAMPFFAPIPWEADRFYAQPGMATNNLTLAWYPVGSGPFILSKNDPNSMMILQKNPNFHGETYPSDIPETPENAPFMPLKGKPLPLIDAAIYSLEKENIPYWYKFLQGYYDRSTISSDNFDNVINVTPDNQLALSRVMQENQIQLETSIDPNVFYLGINMLDPIIGGTSDQARYLRQALAIAIDYEEFINIFLNGRGTPAHSPIPTHIFGSVDTNTDYNHTVYTRTSNQTTRKPLSEAKQLLAKAGYPDGRNAITQEPLVLYLDIVGRGANFGTQANWYRKQFKKLGIDLYIRPTSWNRLQEKMANGSLQIYSLGWNADYPDPENFLFLLYGPNSKVLHDGENASNYNNPEFNRLFEQMKNTPNGSERADIIREMTRILQYDTPWIGSFFTNTFIVSHRWNGPSRMNTIANNTLKYQSINNPMRAQLRHQWNQPKYSVLWTIGAGLFILLAMCIWIYMRHMQNNPTKRFKL